MPARGIIQMEEQKREEALKRAIRNDYYPRIYDYRANPLMRYVEEHNTRHHYTRKTLLNAIQTPQDAQEYARRVKEEFRACLGPLFEMTPLNAKVVDTLDLGYAYMDKVILESQPGLHLAVNFYYPKQLAGPLPGILMLCGHAGEGKGLPMYVDYCCQAVRQGMCVCTFDPVGQGERFYYDREDSPLFEQRSPDAVHVYLGQQLLLFGQTITRYMMHDNVRALDYLLSRAEVDGKRVGVAGNSGGGHMSAFMGAYDDRIAAVSANSYYTTMIHMAHKIGVQENEQSLPGFMERGLDIADLAIAAVPKAYDINGNLFDSFPVEGLRDAIIDVKRVYDLLAPGNFDFGIAAATHGWWGQHREHSVRFFCRAFGIPYNEEVQKAEYEIPSSSDVIVVGDLRTIDRTSIEAIAMTELSKAESNLSLSSVLGVTPALLPLRAEKYTESPSSWEAGTEWSLESQEGMVIRAVLHEKAAENAKRVHLVCRERQPGEPLPQNADAVLYLEVRGEGRSLMEVGSFFYGSGPLFNEQLTVSWNLDMLGESLLGGRVVDVVCAANWLRQRYPAARLTLMGEGAQGFYAELASRFLEDVGLKTSDVPQIPLKFQKAHDLNFSTFAYRLALARAK